MRTQAGARRSFRFVCVRVPINVNSDVVACGVQNQNLIIKITSHFGRSTHSRTFVRACPNSRIFITSLDQTVYIWVSFVSRADMLRTNLAIAWMWLSVNQDEFSLMISYWSILKCFLIHGDPACGNRFFFSVDLDIHLKFPLSENILKIKFPNFHSLF